MCNPLRTLAAIALTCASAFAQTSALSPVAKQQFFADTTGRPLSGGKVCSYAAGTTTPLATYADSIGTPNANPLILDANGRGGIWLGPVAYKIVLRTAGTTTDCTTGTIIYSVDGVFEPGQKLRVDLASTSAGLGAGLVGFKQANASTARTVQTKLQEFISVQDFGAAADGTTSDTAATIAALSATPSAGVLRLPHATYRIGQLGSLSKVVVIEGDGSTVKVDASAADWVTLTLVDQNRYFVFRNMTLTQYGATIPTSIINVNQAINTKFEDLNFNAAAASVALIHHTAGYGTAYVGGSIRGNTAPVMIFYEHNPASGPYTYNASIRNVDFSNDTGKCITIQGGELSVKDGVVESCSLGAIEHVLNPTPLNSWYLSLVVDAVHFEANLVFNLKFPALVVGTNANSTSTVSVTNSTFLTNPSEQSLLLGGQTFLTYINNQVASACIDGDPAQILGLVTYANIQTFGAPASCSASGPSGYLLKTSIYGLANTVGPGAVTLHAPTILQSLSGSAGARVVTFWDSTGADKGGVTVEGDFISGRDMLPVRDVIAARYFGSTNGAHTWGCVAEFAQTNADLNCKYDTVTKFHWDNTGRFGVGTAAALTSPFTVVGLPIYANNAAALVGGLTAGAFYRSGGDPDGVSVVH